MDEERKNNKTRYAITRNGQTQEISDDDLSYVSDHGSSSEDSPDDSFEGFKDIDDANSML